MKNTKGFIGPIGDDLPSLIPLVFALAIFFAAFNNSISNFEQKNIGFSDDLDTLKIARVLRSNGYIINLENFQQLCSMVQVRNVKFIAGIAELNLKAEDSMNPEKTYDYSFIDYSTGELREWDKLFRKDSATGEFFVCSNLKNPENDFTADVLQFKKAIVKVYPIILEKDRGNGLGIIASPMQLVVVSWRD